MFNIFCKFFDEEYSDDKSNIYKISSLAAIYLCGRSLQSVKHYNPD